MGKKIYKSMRPYHVRAKRRANRRSYKSEIRLTMNVCKTLWVWKTKHILDMKWQEKMSIYDTLHSADEHIRKRYMSKLIPEHNE